MKINGRKISALSFLASFVVVLLHASDEVQPELYNRIVFQGVLDFAVPYFFVVSGFFLVKNFSLTFSWWGREIKKRCLSLLLPYVLWNIIALLIAWRGVSLADIGITRITPCNAPLWYIKLLFLSCVISPILAWFALTMSKNRILSILGVFAVVLFLLAGHHFKIPAFHSFGRAVVYVTLGMWVAFGGTKILVPSKASKGAVILLLFLLWTLVLAVSVKCEHALLFTPFLTVPIIWLAYDFMPQRFRNWLEGDSFQSVCKTSFFVYCIHFPLIMASHYNAVGVAESWLYSIIIFAASVLIAVMVRRFGFPIYKIFNGGRA